MKGNTQVIKALQQSLTDELTAIHQYYLHAKVYEDRGLTQLQAPQMEAAKDEMRHADRLIARILFLEGMPDVGVIGKVKVARTTEQMMRNDLAQEHAGIANYKKALAAAVKDGDSGTEQLVRELVVNEEEHVDWLETQLSLIKSLGLGPYEQTKV